MNKLIVLAFLKSVAATFGFALIVTSLAAAQHHPEHPQHPEHPEHPAHPDHPDKGGSRSVPEISAYGAPTGLALVIGGVAVVLGRRSRRKQDER